VAIKVIVELQAKPGMRDELKSLLDGMVAEHGPGQDGLLGSARYADLANPDTVIEIADWESSEARAVHMEEAAATGAYEPLIEMLAAPFRATVIRRLP
jgi:quinol monooxygenase YgiN